jgi:hypothetical protein
VLGVTLARAGLVPDRVSISGHWRRSRHAVRKDVARVHPAYRPRDAEHSVLHAVIREHLEPFLREVSEHGEGAGLPRFVEQEFREFLTCGVLANGFARLRCDECAFERDGPSHLLFEPIEFMEKLAAIIPRPAVNLVLYHGVLAPHGAGTLCILSSNAWNLERL